MATIERDEGRIRLAKPGQCNFFVTTAYYALNCPAFGLFRGDKVLRRGCVLSIDAKLFWRQFAKTTLRVQVHHPGDVALALRDFVSSYLDLDPFGATQPNLSYPVHSLYLDSPGLRLYHTTINGDKNRYKLRIRFYEDRPKTPVYFEVKRRTNNTIAKQRGGVKREALGTCAEWSVAVARTNVQRGTGTPGGC